jgi:PAS domain S-box-containing protein
MTLTILPGVLGTALVHYLVLRAELIDIRKKMEVGVVRALIDNIENCVRTSTEAVKLVGSQVDVVDFLRRGDVSEAAAYASVRRSLSDIQAILPKSSHVALTDASGRELLSSESGVSFSAIGEDLARAASVSPDGVLVGFYASDGTGGTRYFVISAPALYGGRIIGTVTAWMEPQILIDFQQSTGSDSVFALLDGDGEMLARAGMPAYGPQVDSVTAFGGVTADDVEGMLEDENAFIFYARVPLIDVFVLSYAPKSIFYKPLNAFRNYSIGLQAVLLLIGLIYARSLSRFIIPCPEGGTAFVDAAVNVGILGELETEQYGLENLQAGVEKFQRIAPTQGTVCRKSFTQRMQGQKSLLPCLTPDDANFKHAACGCGIMVGYLKSAVDKVLEMERQAQQMGRELAVRNARLEILIADRTEELEHAQVHTKMLIDAAGEAIIEINSENKIVFVNSTTSRMLGFSEQELVGQSFFDTVKHMHGAGKICENLECPFRQAVKGREEAKIYDTYIVKHNGRTIPSSVSVTPINLGDDADGMIISLIDLSKSRAQLQEVLDSSPTAMAIVSNGVVYHVNDKAIDMLGLNMGGNAEKIYANLAEREQIMSLFDKGLTVKDYPMTMRGVFGERFDVLFTVHPFEYEGIPSYAEWISDVTAITQAKIAAENSARTRSLFLARMSHEIRTPMNAIMSLSEVELRNDLPDETRSNIEKIYNSGSLLMSIINDILDISKIDSGNFDIIPVEYDFANLISDVIHLNVIRISDKPIKFESSIDEMTPRKLVGDKIRIKQILNNLLSNAFKYTNEGSVHMSVYCAAQDDHAVLSFSVRDTGIGIKPEDMENLFGDFRQFDKLTNRKIEGTGLGLAICKQLVDLMGGMMHVESEYGRGSIFTVTIRQQIADPTPIDTETARALKTFRLQENRHAKTLSYNLMPYGKVLVVDDVVTNLDVARALMHPYGLTVHCLVSGRQAVETVREGKIEYDIILMDHMMPGTDGLEAVRIIRNDIGTHYAREVPIIALTANALVGNEDMFLENGFQGFISKPIDVLKLDAVLNKWIKDKREPVCTSAPQPQADDVPEILLDGVDTADGIARLGGARAYLEILHSYARHTEVLIEGIRDATPENLGEYAVTVHGIKGASFNISAYRVGKLAERLESAARKSDYDAVALLNGEFITSAGKLISDIRALLEYLEGDSKGMPLKTSPDPETLVCLLEACRNFDSGGIKKASSELGSFSYERDGDLADWLIEQAENLEYDSIVERLEKAEFSNYAKVTPS